MATSALEEQDRIDVFRRHLGSASVTLEPKRWLKPPDSSRRRPKASRVDMKRGRANARPLDRLIRFPTLYWARKNWARDSGFTVMGLTPPTNGSVNSGVSHWPNGRGDEDHDGRIGNP